MAKGRLLVVGTGIQASAHLTPEARHWLQKADDVFYGVADELTEKLIQSLNSNAQTLKDLYSEKIPRIKTYKRMVDRILAPVRDHRTVCVAFYGHPGVFALPGHVAILIARKEGHEAWMLPAVSTADCLFADLGIDPAIGMQSYEATSFLLRGVPANPHSGLILWQVGALGDMGYRAPRLDHLPVLMRALERFYGAEHELYVYEAGALPGLRAKSVRVRVRDLPSAPITHASTLYVPPRGLPGVDQAMMKELGLRPEDVPDCYQ